MGLIFGKCELCKEKIEPEHQYAIMKNGTIYCNKCAEQYPDRVLSWKTAKQPKQKRSKHGTSNL